MVEDFTSIITLKEPYIYPTVSMSLEEAYQSGSVPIREFMSQQIDITGNHDDVLYTYFVDVVYFSYIHRRRLCLASSPFLRKNGLRVASWENHTIDR